MLAGGQRCGSTALADQLARYREISMPRREVEFFGAEVFAQSDPSALARTLGRTGSGPVKGIKRPEYLYDEVAAANISRIYPEMKVIVTVRNRVDRIASALSWYLRDGLVPVGDPERLVRGLLAQDVDLKQWPHAADILEYSRFGPGIARYVEQLGAANVWVTCIDNFTAKEFDQIAAFVTGGATPPSLSPGAVRANSRSGSRLIQRVQRTFAPLDVSLKGPHRYDPRPFWRQKPVGYLARGLAGRMDRVLPPATPITLSVGLTRELGDYFAEDDDLLASLDRELVHGDVERCLASLGARR